MTDADFVVLVQDFARRAMPATTRNGRHIYIWQNPTESLTGVIPRSQLLLLDLAALCRTLDQTPSATNLARAKLDQAIQLWLSTEFPRDDTQRILVVTTCGLLMRYGIPLSAFAQRANENRMVIFVVPTLESNFQPRSLPPFIRLQPDATRSYLKSLLDDALIGG